MISVIVPVYNAQNDLAVCVESIQKQTYDQWEILLVENGSQDNSKKVCRKLAEKDKRIRLFFQEKNVGVSAARNQGMDAARGEYLMFVDADDRLKLDCLEKLIKIQEKTQADMVLCGYTKIQQNRAEEKKKDRRGKTDKEEYRVWEKESYFQDYFLAGNTHCWGVLYQKKLLENIRFPKELSIGEDMLFLLEAALAAKKIVITQYCGYEYWVHSQGAMEKAFTPSYMDQITCWQQAKERLKIVYPKLEHRIEKILLVSILLVVGKLARLEVEERKKYGKEERYCRSLVKSFDQQPGVFSDLPSGYWLKVKLYRYFPTIYLAAYGKWKG